MVEGFCLLRRRYIIWPKRYAKWNQLCIFVEDRRRLGIVKSENCVLDLPLLSALRIFVKKNKAMKVLVDERIREICPDVKIGLIRAKVRNSETSEELWQEIKKASRRIHDSYELLWINKRPAIAATRQLYKRLGKDPNRYRVSSEALCRRVVKGMDIYRISTLVDLINLVSMGCGYSIGGFDADKIVGDTVTFGVGEAGEKFEGIGRGLLNIEGLPVYRDAVGGIGSPTSDEERTKITMETTHLHMQINAFGEEMPMDDTLRWSVSLLEKYASATDIEVTVF